MAKQKVSRTVSRVRVKKDGSTNSAGYSVCRNCGGDGIVKKRKKK